MDRTRKLIKSHIETILLIFGILISNGASALELQWQELTPGVMTARWSYGKPRRVIHAVKVNLAESSIKVSLSPERIRGSTPTEMANELDSIALINASFFNGAYSALGTTMSDGVEWKAVYNKSEATGILACTEANQCRIYHQRVPVNAHWDMAVSGIYPLINDGKPRSNSDDQKCGNFCAFTHPRTAVGLSADNRTLYFVIAEGRQFDLPGISLAELALQMHEIGIYNAMNLDGGGSTGLVIDKTLINKRPANEPIERKVASSIAITKR